MTIEQFNDAKYGELGFVHTGSIDDRMRKQVVAVVGSTKSERAYWLNLFPLGAGTLNDIKSSYFRSLGYTGSVQDMEHRYWASGKGSEDFIRAVAFGSGEIGALFLPDPVSVYQDSAGTTAGVVGQPSGLVLDKRLGLVRGGELVTNGDFSSGAGWTTSAGWAIGSGVATATAVAAFGTIRSSITVTAGVAYEVTFDVTSRNSGAVRASLVGGSQVTGVSKSTTGQYRVILTAVSGNNEVAVGADGSGFDGSIDNVSIKAIPGNHSSQSTAASRPTLVQTGGYYGLRADGGDDSLSSATGGGGSAGILLCAAITVHGGAGTTRHLWGDSSGFNGYHLSIDPLNRATLSAGNGVGFTTSSSANNSTPVGETHVITVFDDGATLNVQIDNGAVTSVARPVVTAGSSGFSLLKNNGAAVNFFPGDLHALVYVKGSAMTADRRVAIKRAIGAKVGISL